MNLPGKIDRILRAIQAGELDPAHLDNATRMLRSLRTEAGDLEALAKDHGAQASQMLRPLPTRYLRVSGAVQLAAATTGNALQVPWPSQGEIVGMFLGTAEGTAAALAVLSVRVVINGTEDLFTDGQNPAFVHAGTMAAVGGMGGVGAYVPISHPYDRSTVWNVIPKNEAAAVTTVTPVIMFAMREF